MSNVSTFFHKGVTNTAVKTPLAINKIKPTMTLATIARASNNQKFGNGIDLSRKSPPVMQEIKTVRVTSALNLLQRFSLRNVQIPKANFANTVKNPSSHESHFHKHCPFYIKQNQLLKHTQLHLRIKRR